MKDYQKNLASLLAESKSLFFKDNLTLKDGRPSPYFVNFGYFRNGRLIKALGEIMADFLVDKQLIDTFDILIGPSYKGSALAISTVIALWHKYQINKDYDYDRKEMKGHGEASQKATRFVTGALFDEARIFIIDDVATSMGTKFDLLNQFKAEAEDKNEKYNVTGIALFMDRQQSTAAYDARSLPLLNKKGKDAIENFTQKTNIPVYSVLTIQNTMKYLIEKEIKILQNNEFDILSEENSQKFINYLNVYGLRLNVK